MVTISAGSYDYGQSFLSLTPPLPAGDAGDLIVAMFTSRMGAAAFGSFSGWTDVLTEEPNPGSPGMAVAIRTKIAGESETDPTFAYNSSSRGWGVQLFRIGSPSDTTPTDGPDMTVDVSTDPNVTPEIQGLTLPALDMGVNNTQKIDMAVAFGAAVVHVWFNADDAGVPTLVANLDGFTEATAPFETTAGSDWAYASYYSEDGAVPPGTPVLTATALSSSSIGLNWGDVTGETAYRVERSPNGATGWTDVSGALGADTTSYSDSGLTADTTYYYRVIATNGVGDSDPSSTVNATTEGGTYCDEYTDEYPESCDGSSDDNRIGGTGAVRRSPTPARAAGR